MTNRDGDVVQSRFIGSYTAFGHERYKHNTAAFDVTNRYTGQQIDDETGLYFYQSRYYDAQLGRFTQADTIVPSANTSQVLNRYSYVENNPLNLTDPTGHWSLKSVFKSIGKLLGKHFGNALIMIGNITGQPWLVAAGTLYNVYCIGDQKFSTYAKQLGVNMGAYYIGQKIGGAGEGAEFAEVVARGAIVGAVNGAITSAIYGGNMGKAMLRGAGQGAMYSAASYFAQPYIQGTLEQMEKSIHGIKMNIELLTNMEIFPDMRIPPGQLVSADKRFGHKKKEYSGSFWKDFLDAIWEEKDKIVDEMNNGAAACLGRIKGVRHLFLVNSGVNCC